MVSPMSLAQTSSTETSGRVANHGDWQVRCEGTGTACVARQEQSGATGERLLVLEIARGQDGGMSGTALLPFGALFDNGVTLRIDSSEPSGPLPFRTCVPTGCVVTFEVDAAMGQRLRAGTTLMIGLSTVARENIQIPVSLAGFTAAIKKVTEGP